MLLVYVDESNRGSHIAFAGLLGTGNEVHEMSLQLSEISRRVAMQHHLERPPVFHAYEMFHGCGVWKGVAPRARVRVFEDVISVVGEFSTRIIFRSLDMALDSAAASESEVTTRSAAEARCLDVLIRCVNDFSLSIGLRALVIADMRTDRERHRDRLERSRGAAQLTDGSQNGFSQILDTIHFAPSRRSRILQAVDVVAFVLSRAAVTERDSRSSAATARLVQKLSASGRLDSRRM